MGAASLEKVQAHSLENIVHQYEILYEKVLAGRCLLDRSYSSSASTTWLE